jgi:disulfide bond formation protein DsbB
VSNAAVNRPTRARMSRKELWNLMGVSAAAWVMVLALVRVWWRVYLFVSQ